MWRVAKEYDSAPRLTMEYSNVRQLIDELIEFPITHNRLIEQLGGVELTASTGDSVPVSEVLNRADEPVYQSTNMLYTTIVGNLDDSFIGRKYSDERGGAHTCPDPRCSTRQFF